MKLIIPLFTERLQEDEESKRRDFLALVADVRVGRNRPARESRRDEGISHLTADLRQRGYYLF